MRRHFRSHRKVLLDLTERLIENDWQDLIRVVLSIREGRLSPAAPLRRLGNITGKTRRSGTWHLDMEPPENEAVGRLWTAA
ncbi:Tn3 family transposase [Streptomyces sp. NPDC001508]|uniref:Tn3 family transposase n=1 Tax=Streptomyces sp. NPDC001508 TaxID=3154656 RepID=UPI003328D049